MADGLDDNAFLQLKQGFSKNKSLRVGTLYKKGKESGKFKKRKFILEHDRLVYSKDTNKKDRSFNFISLQGVSCKSISKEARKHCFEICSGGNVYTLSAGSQFDMKGWMNAIWNQVLEVDQNLKIKKLSALIKKAEEKKTKKDQQLIKQLHTFDGIMANPYSRDLFFTFIAEDTSIPEILDKIKEYRLQCLQNRERAKEIAQAILDLMKEKCLTIPSTQQEEAMQELKRPPIIERNQQGQNQEQNKSSIDAFISYEEVMALQRLMEQKCWSQQLFGEIEERVRSQLKAKYFKSFSRDPRMQRLIEFIPIQSFKLKLRYEPSCLLSDTLKQVSSQSLSSKDDYLKGLLSNIV